MTAPFHWDTSRTLIMGVLNVTPDSFSDGGKFFDVERAVAHARAMTEAGADIIDIGGESTRPGSPPVSAEEELRRIIPVIERSSGLQSERRTDQCGRPTLSGDAVSGRASETPSHIHLSARGVARLPIISIDTTKAAVAEKALAAGARIVNDISALRFDPGMAKVVSDFGAGVVLMHMQGTPQTMQQGPHYGDVVREVRDFLRERVDAAVAAGISAESIAVDPGIGFGKNLEHNLQLLAGLDDLREIGRPLLVGVSRKSFIGKVLGTEVDERIWGTAACVAWAVGHGANIVRVHDVAEMRQVVQMIEAIRKA